MVEYLVRALVNEPDQVRVEERACEGAVFYEVRVAPGDAGRVLGRGGKTVNALRTIVKAAAMKHGQKVYVEILMA